MRTVQCLIFVLFMTVTSLLFAQSQETRDAIQDQQIDQNRADIAILTAESKKLYQELTNLRSSVDRFTGFGIGFGAALTTLQGLSLILTIKNGRK